MAQAWENIFLQQSRQFNLVKMSQIKINPRRYKQIHTTIVMLGRKALEISFGVLVGIYDSKTLK